MGYCHLSFAIYSLDNKIEIRALLPHGSMSVGNARGGLAYIDGYTYTTSMYYTFATIGYLYVA